MGEGLNDARGASLILLTLIEKNGLKPSRKGRAPMKTLIQSRKATRDYLERRSGNEET